MNTKHQHPVLAFASVPGSLSSTRFAGVNIATSGLKRHVPSSFRPSKTCAHMSAPISNSSSSSKPSSSSGSDLESASEQEENYPDIPTDLADLSSDVVVSNIDLDDVRDTDFEERQRLDTYLSQASTGIPIPPKPTVVEIQVTEKRTLRLETGRMARQADGAVLARMGDTIVFCTACAESTVSPTVDFLPLRVDYAEKFSATGRTSGSYVKREGRPSEREVLVSRLIDRSLRPMFETGYFNEVQVLTNVYSYDKQSPADAMAICGAAAALHISHIPMVEPIAGVRIAYLNDESQENESESENYSPKQGKGHFVVEPTADELKYATAELVVAGTRSGILMIEGFCDFLPDDEIMAGVRTAHGAIKRICDGIDRLRVETGSKAKILDTIRTVPPEIGEQLEKLSTGLDEALAVIGKKDRDVMVQGVRDRVFKSLEPTQQEKNDDPNGSAERLTLLRLAWKEFVSERMRRRIIDTGIRPDGRDCFTVRPITIDRAPLPGAHGSALFTRGETQTLAVATLGGDEMAQRSESLDGESAARFYLQYSFPPFSVGEVGWLGPPGRREIGHGKLSERALMAAIPNAADFPYVLRVESNILESNGSSSMASVCGGCLALLEAGVPLKSSVAGVAMGLVVDKSRMDYTSASSPDDKWYEDNSAVLTDILGLEDALGSCDAKFAGNRSGWSALQLDVKLRGIPISLLQRLLKQAAEGRDFVLGEMDKVLSKPNIELPPKLPKVVIVHIPTHRVGELIGPGGKTIKSIIEKCGGENVIRISVGGDDGRVSLSSEDNTALLVAQEIISSYQTNVQVGKVFTGTVTKILPFGAYVDISAGKEAWVHISEFENKHTANVNDICSVGDSFDVKIVEVGRNGQVRASRKALLPRPPQQQQRPNQSLNGLNHDRNGPASNMTYKERKAAMDAAEKSRRHGQGPPSPSSVVEGNGPGDDDGFETSMIIDATTNE